MLLHLFYIWIVLDVGFVLGWMLRVRFEGMNQP